MILRKPYAFLIKYFKIIHIVLFVIFGYLTFKLRDIYTFLIDYVKNGYGYATSGRYTSVLMLLLIILVLISAIFIFMLMKEKQKPVLFYKVLIIYSSILIIYWFVYHNFFSLVNEKELERLTVVFYRDVTAFIYYVNYFYVGLTFIRGFGFDIKKFSFDKDKKELNITEEDRAEYEVDLEFDKDKLVYFFKREKREIKYYFKENALVLTIIGVIILLFLSGYIYFNFIHGKIVHHENSIIAVNNIKYEITKSYITNLDKYSDEMNNYHVIVYLNIDNIYDEDILFDKEKFRLNIDNTSYLYPISKSASISFDDLGSVYNTSTKVKKNTVSNYVFVFKMNNNDYKKIYFEILKNADYEYEKFSLEPKSYTRENKDIKLNEEIIIENTKLKFLSYEINDRYSIKYEECKDSCNTYTKTINPGLNDIVLALKLEELENRELLENYLGFRYTYKDKEYNVSSKDIAVIDYLDNVLYLSVPKVIKNADSIIVTIKTRNNEYYLKLR